jgi:hypothetical protein
VSLWGAPGRAQGPEEGEGVAVGNRREAWRLGATAARRGEAGRGPAWGGERQRRCWGGMWRRGKRRGGSKCSAHGQRGWRGSGRVENRAEGLEVDEGDLVAISQKCRDSTVKPS